MIHLLCLVVPGLGRNLFSVKQGMCNVVISIFNTNNPTLEADKFTFPLQEQGYGLYSFSLNLTDGSSGTELAVQAATPNCRIGD